MPQILVVQHEDDCPPALLGEWLTAAGVRLDVRRPYAGDPLPADLADHDGLLVLGGPMGADDDADHAWIGPTKALIRIAVREELPTLGVCLGHQLIASAVGGEVVRNPAGRQLGLLPLGWSEAAAEDPLLGAVARGDGVRSLHWNQDVVATLPASATLLAVAPGGECQAARFGPRAWGVQPHPEADEAVAAGWAAGDYPEVVVEARTRVVGDVADARDELVAAWRPLAESFAALLTGGRGAS